MRPKFLPTLRVALLNMMPDAALAVTERRKYSVLPAHYFDPPAAGLLDDHREICLKPGPAAECYPGFPEAEVTPHLVNTWSEYSIRIIANWLDSLA